MRSEAESLRCPVSLIFLPQANPRHGALSLHSWQVTLRSMTEHAFLRNNLNIILLLLPSWLCSVCVLSHLGLCDPWIVAHQAPLPVGFSRQEYWSGFPCRPPRDLPDPGIEPASSWPRMVIYRPLRGAFPVLVVSHLLRCCRSGHNRVGRSAWSGLWALQSCREAWKRVGGAPSVFGREKGVKRISPLPFDLQAT